jgi:single-strand DNA-binding protein
MGRSVNKVILLGRAGKDPSVHILRTGTIVNLSLATSERYRDIHGDWQEHTEWHNLVGFQRVGEILRDYVRKGSRLYIEGALRTRSWDDRQTGQRRYRSEIVVTEVSLLSPPPDGGSDDVEHYVSGQGFAPPSSARNRRSRRRKYRTAQSGLSQLLDSWNVLGKSWLLRQDGIRLRVPRVFGWFARLRPDVLHDARLRNHFLVCVGPRSTIQFIYRLQVDRLVKGKMPSVGVNNEVFWCKWQRNLYVDCCQAGRAVERRELVCVRVKHYGRIVRRNEASGVVRYEYRRDHVEKHRS